MAHIELVEQTFRDGQQSLWGMRVRTGMVRDIAEDLDRAGYRAIDITGSTMFECVVRYSREDPWEGLDLWRAWMPALNFRAGVGSNRIGTFGMTPDALIDVWVRTLIRHGINSLWVYDCLYNMDQMRRLCGTIAAAGGQAYGAIMYGISEVHTDEWFASRVAQMASWPETTGIYVEDAHCERVAAQEGFPVGVPREYDAFAYAHHLPGGMTGTLKAQLAQYDMADRLEEVLTECVRVRAELGHPISATPFSQLIGIQSVLNIVSGDRWSVVPDEVIIYLMGKFGDPPALVDDDVKDKVLSSAHGRQLAGWERPQPSLAELRAQYGGPRMPDEELLLRYMVPAEDLDAARAACLVKPGYDFRDTTTLHDLIDHALTLQRPRQLRIHRPDADLTLSRAAAPERAAAVPARPVPTSGEVNE